ncbi:MAG: alpha/beta hydrolase [Pseudomonadota bacterium]|nr:alpha/beta hydrolase [Pseudomonadota bacterium]
MAKQAKMTSPSISTVRTRRAYFDCRFGQLHVRTAFPATGGFDEGVTLLCLHPSEGSGKTYDRFLPEIAHDRSVYAPDLPGFGESDAAPDTDYATAAAAIADLSADLRLRQIDILGFRFGAGVALELARSRPVLVRRLVLVAAPSLPRGEPITIPTLVLRTKTGGGDDAAWISATLRDVRFVDLAGYAADMFDAAPRTLATQIGEFFRAPP